MTPAIASALRTPRLVNPCIGMNEAFLTGLSFADVGVKDWETYNASIDLEGCCMSMGLRRLLALAGLLACVVGGYYAFIVGIKSYWVAHFKDPGWERWKTWGDLLSIAFLLCVGLFCGITWYFARTYSARRYPRGHCQGCGYDLTGNVSGRCPECGREVGD